MEMKKLRLNKEIISDLNKEKQLSMKAKLTDGLDKQFMFLVRYPVI
jgi:hypothetical protein